MNWIRNLDMRWVAFILSGIAALAHGIVSGQLPLDHLCPASWDDSIRAYCGLYLYIFPLVIGAQSATAINWPKLPVPPGAVAKAVIGFLIIGAALAFASPVFAQARHHRVAAPPLPISDPRLPLNATLDAGKTAASAANPNAISLADAQTNFLTVLQKFSLTDLQAALADANGQTPPDTIAAACWQDLITLENNPALNVLPKGPGVAQLVQKGRDDKALAANLLSPTGPAQQLIKDCAPVWLDVKTTVIGLGVAGGVVTAGVASPATTAGVAGLAAAAAALKTALGLP